MSGRHYETEIILERMWSANTSSFIALAKQHFVYSLASVRAISYVRIIRNTAVMDCVKEFDNFVINSI